MIRLELLKIARPDVRQSVLQLLPHPFVKIKFGSVGRKVLHMKTRNLLAQRANQSTPMGNAIVQERNDMPSQIVKDLTEERNDFVLADVVPEE